MPAGAAELVVDILQLRAHLPSRPQLRKAPALSLLPEEARHPISGPNQATPAEDQGQGPVTPESPPLPPQQGHRLVPPALTRSCHLHRGLSALPVVLGEGECPWWGKTAQATSSPSHLLARSGFAFPKPCTFLGCGKVLRAIHAQRKRRELQHSPTGPGRTDQQGPTCPQAWRSASSNVTRRTALGFVMAAGCDTAQPLANQDSERGGSDPAARLLHIPGHTRRSGDFTRPGWSCWNRGPTEPRPRQPCKWLGQPPPPRKQEPCAARARHTARHPYSTLEGGAGQHHPRATGPSLHPCPLGFPR